MTATKTETEVIITVIDTTTEVHLGVEETTAQEMTDMVVAG